MVNKMDANLFINRLKSIYDLQNDTILAEKLKISRNTLASWRHRNYIDIAVVLDAFPNADINYLLNIKNEDNKVKEEKIEYLQDELKKIDVEISEAERNISETGKGIRADAIKELDRLRAENAKLLEIIHNLSAKI